MTLLALMDVDLPLCGFDPSWSSGDQWRHRGRVACRWLVRSRAGHLDGALRIGAGYNQFITSQVFTSESAPMFRSRRKEVAARR